MRIGVPWRFTQTKYTDLDRKHFGLKANAPIGKDLKQNTSRFKPQSARGASGLIHSRVANDGMESLGLTSLILIWGTTVTVP